MHHLPLSYRTLPSSRTRTRTSRTALLRIPRPTISRHVVADLRLLPCPSLAGWPPAWLGPLVMYSASPSAVGSATINPAALNSPGKSLQVSPVPVASASPPSSTSTATPASLHTVLFLARISSASLRHLATGGRARQPLPIVSCRRVVSCQAELNRVAPPSFEALPLSAPGPHPRLPSPHLLPLGVDHARRLLLRPCLRHADPRAWTDQTEQSPRGIKRSRSPSTHDPSTAGDDGMSPRISM